MTAETDAKGGYVGGDNTNLIINYLPQSLTDDEFRNMFLSVGPIKSCRVIRDKTSNYSYGFGFVDYFTEDDAKRAITTLNGYHLQGKTIKCALARPGTDDIKGANLYIRNLPISWTKENLDNCFAKFGDIVQSRVLFDHLSNVSRRVGFVLYKLRSEAEAAIEQMDGKKPDGEEAAIYVKFANEGGSTQGGKKSAPGVPDQQIPNFFPNANHYFGFQQGMNFPGNRNPGGNNFNRNPGPNNFNRNPGPNNFNNFGNPAMNPMNPGNMGGNSGSFPSPGPIRNQSRTRYNPVASNQGPNMAGAMGQGPATNQNSGSADEGHALYVYNTGACNEKNLWDMFTQFGVVAKVAIVYDKGVSKGYAFVTMPNYNEAQNAIYHLNGYDLLSNGRFLQVSFKGQSVPSKKAVT